MKFYVPLAGPSQAEAVYAELVAAAKDQFGWPVTDRRIRRLDYTHDKHRASVEVGQAEANESSYKVRAILESKLYLVMTCDVRGKPGPTILVDKAEVTAEEDFDAKVELEAA